MKLPSAKYLDWRCNIETGDFLLCMGKSKKSKGIQWTEEKQDKNPLIFSIGKKNIKGFFTHVGVFVRVLGHIFIVEANGKTVDFTRFSRTYRNYDGHLFIVRPPKFLGPTLTKLEMAANCLEVEGNKYDWKSIWKQLINIFNEEAYKHKEDKQLFCSELVNMASKYYWKPESEWCTPHDIALAEQNSFLVHLTDVK